MSGWQAYGVERCLKCDELYTFNHYNFEIYFERSEGCRREIDLICHSCLRKEIKTND